MYIIRLTILFSNTKCYFVCVETRICSGRFADAKINRITSCENTVHCDKTQVRLDEDDLGDLRSSLVAACFYNTSRLDEIKP